KGTIDPGYARVQAILDPQADTEPSAEMKRATKRYSHMAVTCFVVTLLAIAALLVQQLFTESYDAAVERIMIGGIAVMVGIAVVYAIYRYIDAKHN
ncbi:MAG: sodium:solute symporter, partial [Alistipes sp.]|nr:sodium:solute symporter [Alistipes sp.]